MTPKTYIIVALVLAGLAGLYGLYRHGKTVDALQQKSIASDTAAQVQEAKDEIRNIPYSLDASIDELCRGVF